MDILLLLLWPLYFPVSPLDGVTQKSTNVSLFLCKKMHFGLSGFVALACMSQ